MTSWQLYCALHCQDLVVLGYCCETHGCTDVASSRIFWPGRGPSLKCARHRQACETIAEALGFTLHSVAVPHRAPPGEEPDPTSQRFAAMEMT